MKRKTTKEILAESFRELAAEKPIDKITVKDIVLNCGYSQATFYRQFRDKYDLIAWNYASGLSSVMEKIGEEGYVWKQTLIDGAQGFQQDRDYLSNLLRHTEGQDSFIRYMSETNFEALKRHIEKVTGTSELPDKIVMYIRLYCLGTVSFACEWILGKYQSSAEDLAEVFLKSLPQPLHQYLLEDGE